MSYKRATETTQVFLENQPLPNHGKSYTVVSHKEVIDNTKKLLEDSISAFFCNTYFCIHKNSNS